MSCKKQQHINLTLVCGDEYLEDIFLCDDCHEASNRKQAAEDFMTYQKIEKEFTEREKFLNDLETKGLIKRGFAPEIDHIDYPTICQE